MQGWHSFVGDIQQCYGVDMSCLNATFQKEQQQYYLATSAWADVHPSQLQGPPVCIRSYDLATLTQQELAAPLQVSPCPGHSGCPRVLHRSRGWLPMHIAQVLRYMHAGGMLVSCLACIHTVVGQTRCFRLRNREGLPGLHMASWACLNAPAGPKPQPGRCRTRAAHLQRMYAASGNDPWSASMLAGRPCRAFSRAV